MIFQNQKKVALFRVILGIVFFLMGGCLTLHGEELLKVLKQKELSYSYPIHGKAIFQKMPAVVGVGKGSIFIYLKDDSFIEGDEVWMVVTEKQGKSRCDIYIQGDWLLYQSLFISIDFDEVMKSSFDKIAKSLDAYVDWNIVLPQSSHKDFKKSDYMIRIIRNRLKRIEYVNDLAIDKGDEFVKITDNCLSSRDGLSSSGFVKWVVDGLYQGRLGENIPITFLKQKPYRLRGGEPVHVFEDAENPYFCLDWSRNLALAIDLLDNEQAVYGDCDVDFLPELTYFKDIGYSIGELKRALYLLAINRPGYFFMGSVNQFFKIGESDLRKHFELAIFFPRINLEGQLEIITFESGKELSFESFLNKYRGAEVHLVEFKGTYQFKPTHFETLSIIKR